MRYPRNMTDTVTLYLKLPTEPRQRVVLHNCCWGREAGRVKVGDMLIMRDNIKLQIPKSPNFLPTDQWRSLDDKGDKWTVDTDTVAVLGECSVEMSENPKIPNSKTKAQFLSTYQGSIFAVEQFINHATEGRPLPHYVCKGAL